MALLEGKSTMFSNKKGPKDSKWDLCSFQMCQTLVATKSDRLVFSFQNGHINQASKSDRLTQSPL